MKKNKLFVLLSGIVFSPIISCSSLTGIGQYIKLSDLEGFRHVDGVSIEDAKFVYTKINEFKKQYNIDFQGLLELIAKINFEGTTVRYRWKGNVFPDSSITVTDTSYRLSQPQDDTIKKFLPNSVTVVDKVNKSVAEEVTQYSNINFCNVVIVIYDGKKAIYYDMKDSFGIHLSKVDTDQSFKCTNSREDYQLQLLEKPTLNEEKEKLAQALLNLFNQLKQEKQLTNKQVSSILAMSNIQATDLNYSNSYKTGSLTVTKQGFNIDSAEKPIKWTIPEKGSKYLVLISENNDGKTSLLGISKLKSLNRLKILIHKNNTTFFYDTSKIKYRTIQ